MTKCIETRMRCFEFPRERFGKLNGLTTSRSKLLFRINWDLELTDHPDINMKSHDGN